MYLATTCKVILSQHSCCCCYISPL